MATGIHHPRISQARDILLGVIANRLYPMAQYPRTLFPDLGKILVDEFMTILKSDPGHWNRFMTCSSEKDLTSMAGEILGLENLLKNNPRSLILIYRYLISKYIGGKHQKADEKEDLIQEIIFRLMTKKIPKIQKQYDFNFKKNPSFTSYFMVVVRNVYIDIVRERKKKVLKTVELSEADRPLRVREFGSEDGQIILEEETTKLHYLFKMYHRSRPKIEIMLKIKYRMSVDPVDVRNHFPGCPTQEISILTRDFKFMKDKEVFEVVTPVFNRCEKKRNKSDTLRKWIANKIEEIVSHLNRTHDHRVYNTENISDLVTIYFQKKWLKRDPHDI